MTERNTTIDLRLGALDQKVSEAALALQSLEQPARETALAIDDAFEKAGKSLVHSLGKAASDGKITLKELANAVLDAIEASMTSGRSSTSSGADLTDWILNAGTTLLGGRADGGPVSRYGAYVVGENGPEIFQPRTDGAIVPLADNSNIQINLHLRDAPQSILRSQTQLAAMIHRAVRLGVR